jgi:hypothetical protein
MTLYASNVQRTRVELREEDGLFYLWAYRRGDGKTLFRDRTDRYSHALNGCAGFWATGGTRPTAPRPRRLRRTS